MAKELERTVMLCASDLRRIADAMDSGNAQPLWLTETREVRRTPVSFGETRIDYRIRVRETPQQFDVVVKFITDRPLEEIIGHSYGQRMRES
jgi:hypothetical protein